MTLCPQLPTLPFKIQSSVEFAQGLVFRAFHAYKHSGSSGPMSLDMEVLVHLQIQPVADGNIGKIPWLVESGEARPADRKADLMSLYQRCTCTYALIIIDLALNLFELNILFLVLDVLFFPQCNISKHLVLIRGYS